MKNTLTKFGWGGSATGSLVMGLMLAASVGQAQPLLLDFGPTVATGTDVTLSMGHFAGAVPLADIAWNKVVNANVTSGLLYGDGSAATGVSVTVGRSDAGVGSSVDFNNILISSSALGTSENIGIYTNTSPLKDGIFATGTATVNTNAAGIRVNGLAAGVYTIYISGRNSNTGVTAPEGFFATNGASSSSFAFATNTTPSAVEANSATAPGAGNPSEANAITSTFAYGDNCVALVVTLGSGDSLYLAGIGASSTEYRGFLNAVEIVPGFPVLTNFPATIGVQPTANVAVYAGATVTIGNVKYGGMPPLYYQWYYQGTPIAGATNAALALQNVTTNQAGNYNVSVQNTIATNFSSNAVVTVVPLFSTGRLTNIWNILPGNTNYPYITTTAGGERSLIYNAATTNLLVLTHQPTNNLVALDPATGDQEYFMNLAGIPAGAGGVNVVGVADDGTVYGGSVVANASSASTPFLIWQWSNDSSNSIPSLLFDGDPGYGTLAAGLRWGDNLAVRGAGATTEILIAPGSETNGYGTNVILFTTPDGLNLTPVVIGVAGVPSGFGQSGIAFGPGTNTFWAKASGQELYLVQFDLNAQTGTVLNAYGPTNGVPGTFQFINVDPSQKWLAGVMSVASGLPDNVRLYDISNLTNGPALADQELNPTTNGNSFNFIGVGSTAFGGNYLFSLDSQNGIRAFLINTNIAPVAFSITSITPQSGPAVALIWPSVAGQTYQVQSEGSLLANAWTNVGSPITAADTITTVTNTVSGAAQFFRVQAQ